MRDHWVHAFVAFTVGLSMLACSGEKSSSTQKATPGAPIEASEQKKNSEPKPLEGEDFNQFFPADGAEGTKRVFKQEKPGFAQADYTDSSGVVVTVSISDTANNPSARDKFDRATDTLQGAPLTTRGKNSTLLLAGGRFQVQLASKTLDEKGRKVWVEKIDVQGLKRLSEKHGGSLVEHSNTGASAAAVTGGAAAVATAKYSGAKPFDGKPLEGQEFNQFFPADGAEGTKRVFKQEKPGFAQADYTDSSGVVVTVSISDTANNPSARDKFDRATDTLQGAPLTTRGKNSTLLLAGGRFQVQLASKTLDEQGRKVWVEKIDVQGLGALNN